MFWDLDPAMLRTEGGIEVRHYGMAILLGYGLALVMAGYFAERAGAPAKRVTWMLVWSGLAAFACSHVAHIAIYEPESLDSAVRLMQLGSGQSSHGAMVSALFVLALVALLHRDDPRVYFDSWVSGMVFAIPFVRLGNLTNSELVGRPWDGPWAFVFPRYDCAQLMYQPVVDGECPQAIARHPWPIYDALVGLALIALAIALRAPGIRRAPGSIFLVLWTLWLGARFMLGFLLERMTPFDGMLTVEQWASLTSLAVGVVLLFATTALWRRSTRSAR